MDDEQLTKRKIEGGVVPFSGQPNLRKVLVSK